MELTSLRSIVGSWSRTLNASFASAEIMISQRKSDTQTESQYSIMQFSFRIKSMFLMACRSTVLHGLIPNHTDVLITHTPPFGILDLPRSGRNVGCPYLRSIVSEIAPRLHCFGHVHASAGRSVQEKTTFVNASVIDSNYFVCHTPIVIDIDR